MYIYFILLAKLLSLGSALKCFYCLKDAHMVSSKLFVTPNSPTSGCPDSAPSALLNCPEDFVCVLEAISSRTKSFWTVTKGCRKPSAYDVHIDSCMISADGRYYRCSCKQDFCNHGTAEDLKVPKSTGRPASQPLRSDYLLQSHLEELNGQKKSKSEMEQTNTLENIEEEPMIQNIRIPKSSLELNITVHSDARNYIKGDDGMEASDYNTTEAYFEMEINSTDDHGNMSGSHDQLITETVTVETSHHSDTHVALAETTTAETPADHHLHTTDHSTQDSEHQNVTEMIETVNDTMESITSDHSIDHPVDQNSTNHTNVETILDTTTTIDNGTFETETSTEAGMTTDHFSNGTAEVLDEAMNETSANETTTSEPQFANLIQPNDESEPHLTTVINHEVERETHNETTAIVVTSSSKKPCGMLPSEHEVHNNTQKHD